MQKHLSACGVKPQVVGDIADLQPLLERDGAAVIDGPECVAEATRALARHIFAEKTLAIPDAARVFEGIWLWVLNRLAHNGSISPIACIA